MTYMLTKRQKEWFANADKAGITAFLAKGPAEVPGLCNNETLKPVYRPMVRGVLLDEDAQPSFEAALALAETGLAKFRADAAEHGYIVDERALGIDDVQRDLGERLRENNLRVNWIVPLAGIDTPLPEALAEWLEDLEPDHFVLAERMPSLARLLKRRDEDEDGEYTGRHGQSAMQEEFVAAIYDDQALGCLIRVSQPVPTDKWDGGGVGFSWGYTSFQTLYGETYESAMEAAIAWGVKTWEEAKAALPDRKTG